MEKRSGTAAETSRRRAAPLLRDRGRLALARLLGGGEGGLGRLVGAGVVGDELLRRLAREMVGALVVGRLHEVGAGAVELAGEAVVEAQLAAAHGVDDD